MCPNLAVPLKNTCGYSAQVVPVGLLGTDSTPDFGAAGTHPHWLPTRDGERNNDPSTAANAAYGRKWTVIWKRNLRVVGGELGIGGLRRVAGAEAEGPRGKDGSEMNTHYDHYKYHPKKQTLGSLLNQQQRLSHVSTFISQTAGLFHFTPCTHLNLWDVYMARTHVRDH